MATALITGASSGIGAAFADLLAKERYDIVLVARNPERLEEAATSLGSRFGIRTETLVADLATDEGIALVEARIGSTANPIHFLVNNAGFGIKGSFSEAEADDHEAVLRVNGLAVLRLTHAAMREMVKRGSGDIINVSSVAAFTPGVRPSSTYAASKAFVAALTEGLAPSVIGTNIHLSSVCPGWTKSEFHKRAGIGMSKLPNFLWQTPEFVAETALKDHRAGKVLVVPGLIYKVIMGVMRATPRPVVLWASRIAGKLSH